MEKNIAVLAGDGIGPEITREGVRALQTVAHKFGHSFTLTDAPFGVSIRDRHAQTLHLVAHAAWS